MEQIITSCAFLAWVYDANSNRLTKVAHEGKSPSQIRLDKAVVFSEERIYAYFGREHPYMLNPTGRSTPEILSRLSKYKRMFGYYTGHWFIEELTDSLTAYARKRPQLDSSQLDALTVLGSAYTETLDSISMVDDRWTERR